MRYIFAATIAATFMASTAVAQTTTMAPAAKAPAASSAKPTRAPVVRTAKSLDCSKQADTKGLHGKPRKSFMSSCKKA